MDENRNFPSAQKEKERRQHLHNHQTQSLALPWSTLIKNIIKTLDNTLKGMNQKVTARWGKMGRSGDLGKS